MFIWKWMRLTLIICRAFLTKLDVKPLLLQCKQSPTVHIIFLLTKNTVKNVIVKLLGKKTMTTDLKNTKKKTKTKVPIFHRIVISSIFMHLLLKLFFLFLNFYQLVSENSQVLENDHFTKPQYLTSKLASNANIALLINSVKWICICNATRKLSFACIRHYSIKCVTHRGFYIHMLHSVKCYIRLARTS